MRISIFVHVAPCNDFFASLSLRFLESAPILFFSPLPFSLLSSSSSLYSVPLLAMAFAHYLVAVPVDTSIHLKTPIACTFSSPSAAAAAATPLSLPFSSLPVGSNTGKLSVIPRFPKIGHRGKFVILCLWYFNFYYYVINFVSCIPSFVSLISR